VHGRETGDAHETASTQETATVDGFGEQSPRVGIEWRRVDEEQRAALVRQLVDDVASLRPLEKSRR
jgi:hypothetical protein